MGRSKLFYTKPFLKSSSKLHQISNQISQGGKRDSSQPAREANETLRSQPVLPMGCYSSKARAARAEEIAYKAHMKTTDAGGGDLFKASRLYAPLVRDEGKKYEALMGECTVRRLQLVTL